MIFFSNKYINIALFIFQFLCLSNISSSFQIFSPPSTTSSTLASLSQESTDYGKRIQHLLYNTATPYLDYREYYSNNERSKANFNTAPPKKESASTRNNRITTTTTKSRSSASSKIRCIENIEEMKSFFGETSDKNQLVCIAYFAPWCKSCQKLKVHYNRLASSLLSSNGSDDTNNSIQLATIQHLSKATSLTSSLQVNAFPTIQLYYGYHKVYEISGGEKKNIKKLEAEIKSLGRLSLSALSSLSKRRDDDKILERLILDSHDSSSFDLEEAFLDSEDIYALV